MRRRSVFAVLAGVSLAGGFVACGLDENGQADGGGVDATSGDAPIDVLLDVPIDVPQACKTLDASACIGDASVPDGWTLVVITPGDQICPVTTDYDKTSFLTNLQPQGICTCSCTVSGAVDCSGRLDAGSGGGCTDPNKHTIFDAGNDAMCVVTNWTDKNYQIQAPPTSTASLGCDASNGPAPGWSADAETFCTPKCTADYCNVGSTYKRCIVASQSLSCPPGPFSVAQPIFGVEAGVVTQCTGCGCNVNPTGKCTATIQPFNGTNCDTAVDDASPAGGSCQQGNGSGANANVNSFSYVPIVPDASCSTTGGTASAQFAGTVTVCCLP